jgi:hypothetical protein
LQAEQNKKLKQERLQDLKKHIMLQAEEQINERKKQKL